MTVNNLIHKNYLQISNFILNAKVDNGFDLEYIEQHIKAWPFQPFHAHYWSVVVSAIKSHILEINEIYFKDFVQIEAFSEAHKREVLIFINFLQTLAMYQIDNLAIDLYEWLYFLIYNIDHDISYSALFLLNTLIQQLKLEEVSEYVTKGRLCYLDEVISLKEACDYKYKEICFNFKEQSILSINQILIDNQIEENEYVKILFAYKLFNDKKTIDQKHLISGLLIFTEFNDSKNLVKDVLDVALESVIYTQNVSYKMGVFEMLATLIKKKFRIKIIFDSLRLRMHGEFLAAEFENLHTQNSKYIKSFMKFVTACIMKSDYRLSFCINYGLIKAFKNVISLELADHGLSLVELKTSILRCLYLAIDDNNTSANLTILYNDIFNTLYKEIDIILSILPIKNFEAGIKEGTIFTNEIQYLYNKYFKASIKIIEKFYYIVIPRGSNLAIPNMLNTPIMKIFEKILINHQCYSYKVLFYILKTILIYIDEYPLSIEILQNNNFIDALYGVYDSPSYFSPMAFVCISLINCLSLNKEACKFIIKKKLLEKIINIILSVDYLVCVDRNSTALEVDRALKDLFNNHSVYRKVVYDICNTSLKEIRSMKNIPDEFSSKSILQMFNCYDEKAGCLYFIYNKHNMYKEKIRNLMMIYNSLSLLKNFDELEVREIVLSFADMFSSNYFFIDDEEYICNLFKTFFSKNSKRGSKVLIYDRIIVNLISMIFNINSLNPRKCIDHIIKVEDMFLNPNTRPKQGCEISEIHKLLGSETNEFELFVLNLHSISRSLTFLKLTIFSDRNDNQLEEITKQSVQIFEEIFHIYKDYLCKKGSVYLNYSEDFYLSMIASDSKFYNNCLDYTGSRIGLLINILHLSSMELFWEVWSNNDGLNKSYMEHIFSLLVDGNSSIFDNENIHIAPFKTFAEENKNNLLDTTERRQMSLPLEIYENLEGIEFILHISATFYLANTFFMILEEDGIFLTDDYINDLITNTFAIIKILKNLHAKNKGLMILPLLSVEIPTKKSHSINGEQFARMNTHGFNNINGVVGIMTKCLMNNLRTLSMMIDRGFFVLTQTHKIIIIDLLVRVHFMNNCKFIGSLIAEILRWLVPDQYYDIKSYVDYLNMPTIDDISYAKCFLDSLLLSNQIENSKWINSKTFYNYLLKRGGYTFLGNLQKNKINAWYCLLDNNKYILDTVKNTDSKYVKIVISELINNNLLIYMLKNPCTCHGANKKLLVPKINGLVHEETDILQVNKLTNHILIESDSKPCNAHYDNVLLEYLEDVISFNMNDITINEMLRTSFVFQKMCEYDLIYTKEKLFEKFNWKNLFTKPEMTNCKDIYPHILSIVFYFFEDDSFIKKVIKSELSSTSDTTQDLSIPNFRNKDAFKQIVKNSNITVKCAKKLNCVQMGMFNVLLENLFITTHPTLILPIICQALIYFPALVFEIPKRKFINKLFTKFILCGHDKTNKREKQQYNWLVNLISTILTRTNDNKIKRFLIECMIRNMNEDKETNSIKMLNLLEDIINAELLDNKYKCNCIRHDLQINKQTSRPDNKHIVSENTTQLKDRNLEDLTNGNNEFSGGNTPPNLNDNNIIVNGDKTRSNCDNAFQSTTILITDLLEEKNVVRDVLHLEMNENTTPHIISFLNTFYSDKNKNRNVKRHNYDFDNESSSNSHDTLEENKSSCSSDQIIKNSMQSTVDDQAFIAFIDFVDVIVRWKGEYLAYMKDLNEYYVIGQPDLYNISNNNRSAAFNMDEESTIQETCIHVSNCLYDESSIGCSDGEYPNLDPDMLNEMNCDMIKETAQLYYDEKTNILKTYAPIHTQFLILLDDNVRIIFEDFEIRYKKHFKLQAEMCHGIIPLIKNQAFIDAQYIDHVLDLILSNLSDESAIRLSHTLFSNSDSGTILIKNLLNKLRKSSIIIRNAGKDANMESINVKFTASNILESSLELIYMLINKKKNLLYTFSLHDINLFYDMVDLLSYEKFYSIYDKLNLIFYDYEVMKKILINTEDLKVEFSNDFIVVTKEFYTSHKDDIYYLPEALSMFNDHKTLMSILDSNLGYILRHYINRSKWFEIIRSSYKIELLDHFEKIIAYDLCYLPTEYIEFIFGDLLRILGEVDLKNYCHKALDKIFFYFKILMKCKSTIYDNGNLDVGSIDGVDKIISSPLFFKDCRKLFDKYRLCLEQSIFWDNFFDLIKDSKDEGLSFARVFECFCILRALRFDKDGFKKLIEYGHSHDINGIWPNSNKSVLGNEIPNADKINNGNFTDNNIHEVRGEIRIADGLTNDSKGLINDIEQNKKSKYPNIIIKEISAPINNVAAVYIKDEVYSESRNFESYFVQKMYGCKGALNILFNATTIKNNYMEVLLYSNVLSFENRRDYIKNKFISIASGNTYYLCVERNKVFKDSFSGIIAMEGKDLANIKLDVEFRNEEGVDGGGLTREFYTVIGEEITNPEYCLFTLNQDKRTYSFKKSVSCDEDYFLFYEYIGRIIAKGVIDGVHTSLHFTSAYYKQILNLDLTLADLKMVEPDFYNSYLWMKENSLNDVVDLKFCAEFLDSGEIIIEDLIEDGRNIQVNDTNKELYIQLMTQFLMTKGCEKQMKFFKKGFYEVISHEYIGIFNQQELELLICGLPIINVDDWKNNTEYSGYKVTSEQVQWFWRCVREMSNVDKGKLLQFVTGTSKVPVGGFKDIRGSDGKRGFQIHKGGSGLPRAYTCFNQIDIPVYVSYEELSSNLLYAIRECNTGFGFV